MSKRKRQHTGGKATRQNGDLADRITNTTADNTGLARLLRRRKPTGGLVMLSGYARVKGVTGIR